MSTSLEFVSRKFYTAIKKPLLSSDISWRRRLTVLMDYRRPESKRIIFVLLILLIFCWNLQSLRTPNNHSQRTLFRRNPVREKIRNHLLRTIHDFNFTDCAVLAAQYPEPYSQKYHNQRIDLRGPMYALYRWNGKITKDQLDYQRNLTKNRNMPDNTRIHFKIKDSLLYVDETDIGFEKVFPRGPKVDVPSVLKDRFDRTVELILLALEIYDLPDVDFVLELQDHTYGPPVWDPVMTYSHWAGHDKQGFTFPSFELYEKALGEHQTYVKHECLRLKYPYDKRIRKVAWRGDSTGHPISSVQDLKLNQRVSLSFLGKKLPDILDVGLVDYVQVDLSIETLKEDLEYLAPLKKDLSMEEYNKYAAVIDVDGNAWSDRIALLLSSNVPIFKQEYTHWNDYFGHLLTDKRNVLFFKDDLSDLVEKVDDFLHLYDVKREVLEQQVESGLEFAVEYLSQLGVIRAAAYVITAYASKLDFEVEEHENYRLIPSSKCCKFNPGIPVELIKKINPDYQTNLQKDTKQNKS